MNGLSINDLPKNISNIFKKPDHKFPTKLSILIAASKSIP